MTLTLTPNECRVLGVLVEKAHTTPAQYPLTLNGMVSGCNQKSNRAPVLNLDETQVLDALDGLRGKGLAREVSLSGSRVAKYRHTARETLEVDTSELVVLTELLLRGPQTVGEIRGRASRMHPLESIDIVTNILENLMQRESSLVKQVPPAPGSRAPRFAQLLCPDLHPIEAGGAAAPTTASPAASTSSSDLERRVEALESRVVELADSIARITTALGG